MSQSTPNDKEIKPHQESNQDKGDQETYQDAPLVKKPNAEPDHPLKEQK